MKLSSVNEKADQTYNPYPFIFKNSLIIIYLSPLFLIFISSVLYFIKNINKENRANAAVMISNGNNIEECIDDFDKILIDAG